MFKVVPMLAPQAQTKSNHEFCAFMIMTVIHRVRDGRMSCRIFFLKVKKLLELQRFNI